MLKIYVSLNKASIDLPIFESGVSAGFPSPAEAEDHLDLSLDLNEYIIKHPASTFYVYAKGDSMLKAGIHDGDLLVVDKSLSPIKKNIVIAIINGEFTVKRIISLNDKIYLNPDNEHYSPIEITSDMDFQVWGVVTHTIHKYI